MRSQVECGTTNPQGMPQRVRSPGVHIFREFPDGSPLHSGGAPVLWAAVGQAPCACLLWGSRHKPVPTAMNASALAYHTLPTPPRVGKPGGQRVGERVGDAFYPTWRAGSKFWSLAQNRAYYAVLAVQVSFHFAWHSSISAAPKILVFGNFAESRRLVGPLADSGGGGCIWTVSDHDRLCDVFLFS